MTPQVVAPGGELSVEVPRNVDGVGCESRMPATARYEVRILSEEPAADPAVGRYVASLDVLDPSDDGDAEGTVRLPEDVPAGKAEVLVSLRWAPTVCDLDPSIGCAKDRSAPIDVVG